MSNSNGCPQPSLNAVADATFPADSQVSHAWTYITTEPESPPIVLSGLILGFMLLPSKASWSLFSSRRRFCRTLLRVFCAGFVPVLWRDVLLANVLSSLVKPLVDINHALCCAPSALCRAVLP